MKKVLPFILTFIFLLIFTAPTPKITDELIYFNISKNIITSGKFIADKKNIPAYQRFSPVYSIILSPYIYMVKYITTKYSVLNKNYINWGLIMLWNILIVFIIYFFISKKIGDPLISFFIISSTMLIIYSKTLFSEPIMALILFLIFYYSDKKKFYLVMVLSCLLVLIKPVNIIYIPVIYITFLFLRENNNLKNNILFIFISAILPSLILLSYNFYMRGNFFDFGYSPYYYDHLLNKYVHQGFSHSIMRGLTGFIVSPAKSYFIYNPLMVLGIAGLIIGFLKKREVIPGIILVILIQTFILFAGWSMWEGGMCWGPRFLLITVPIVSFGFIYLKPFIKTIKGKTIFLILSVFGLTVNLFGLILPFNEIFVNSKNYGTGYSFPIWYNPFKLFINNLDMLNKPEMLKLNLFLVKLCPFTITIYIIIIIIALLIIATLTARLIKSS